MKEATGELNMTVVTVVAIAAVAAIVTVFVLPTIKREIKEKSCHSAGYNLNQAGDDCDYSSKYDPTEADEGQTKTPNK